MYSIELPAPIKAKLEELNRIVNEYPDKIPVKIVADFLYADYDGLHSAAEHGQLPFGFGWQKEIKGNRAFCIPTTPFYLWYTQCAAFRR